MELLPCVGGTTNLSHCHTVPKDIRKDNSRESRGYVIEICSFVLSKDSRLGAFYITWYGRMDRERVQGNLNPNKESISRRCLHSLDQRLKVSPAAASIHYYIVPAMWVESYQLIT